MEWFYGIVYNKVTREIGTAEIYEGKGFSFCQTAIIEEKLKDIQATLLNLSLKAANMNYYIWDGKELKHASK